MTSTFLKESDGSILINLKAIPNASKDQVVGIFNDEFLKIKVTKAPESGKANKAIEKLLALFFDLKKKDVEIISGHTTSLKVVKLSGITKADVIAKIR